MADKMKILMTTDTLGGVWNYSLMLCKALQEYNIEVHLAAMGAVVGKHQKCEAAKLSNVTLYNADFKLEWMENPWEDVKKAENWISCIYQTIRPDLVHFNNFVLFDNFWECPVITVFHSCVITWWQSVWGAQAPKKYDPYIKLVNKSLNASNAVISPTKSLLKKAVRTHHITSETSVIHNGIPQNDTLKHKKGNIVFCAGRIWDEAKNLQHLGSLAAKIPWPVYVAGNNKNPNTGEEILIENVHFLGELSFSEMRCWLERAKIFFSPTKYEPFGLGILEAANASCTLVLNRLNTLVELWEGCASFFDVTNENETLQALLKIINNEDYNRELAALAKERSRQYTQEKMGGQYHQLYTKLLDTQLSKSNQLSYTI